MSTGNYRFVVTQKPFQHLCDACESCYSCDSSPRTGAAPHAFWPHPVTLFRARFVTATQQVLALAVVCAALTPAVGVMSLDVVAQAPEGSRRWPLMSAYGEEALKSSKLPERPGVGRPARGPADPARRPDKSLGRMAARTPNARVAAAPGGGSRLTSLPQRRHRLRLGRRHLGTRHPAVRGGPAASRCAPAPTASWSGWTDLEYHDDHGPDPDSEEGRSARLGTDPLLVGRVDQVQVRADAQGVPAQRHAARRHRARASRSARSPLARRSTPAPSTATTGRTRRTTRPPSRPRSRRPARESSALAAATYTPQPVIYSRAQWGANENIRDKGSLHYYEVHAGFVHHTVNANDYTPDEVPGILRSIYAYHTQSRGWSDIGYNFLVDKFGRIWEGRYGGVDRPVVGAHTLNYNDYSFAMSAIGNFETAQPQRRDAAGLRRAVRLEAQPPRRRRRLDAAAGGQDGVPGDQRPPRRRGHGLPRQVPLRADPADPSVRRGGPAGLGGPRARVERRGDAVPRPAGAQEVRQPGVRRAHQRHDPLRAADLAGRRLVGLRPGAARARRDR